MEMKSYNGEDVPIVPAKRYLGSVGHLYDLARDRSVQSRTELAREICSILEADITVRESEMVADVLIDLLEEAGKSVRKTLACRLSLLESAPLRLILQLANDDIDVARPVLTTSPVLGDFDLMYIIKSQGSEYWKAIAVRKKLANQVTQMLAGTNDVETALTLLENEGVFLCETTMIALSDLAQQEEAIVTPLLERDEMSTEIAGTLYQYVGEELKQYIVDQYDIDKDQVTKSIEQIVEDSVESCSFFSKRAVPETRMIEAACAARDKGFLNVQMMIGTLRRGHAWSFVAQLSVFTELDSDVVTQILTQNNGQGLALIARAFDINKQDFISLFMLTGKFWKNGQFVHPNDIRQALKYFDKATREFALGVIMSEGDGK